MHYFVYTLVVWGMVYLLVGTRIYMLWKPGLFGAGIEIIVDSFAIKYNLYNYPKGIVYVGNLPLFQVINVYGVSMLYLNWLPKQWSKRIMYTAYVSVLFLTIEALMYTVGGIAYPNWSLWYSYFLSIPGLLLVAFLSDFVNRKKTLL